MGEDGPVERLLFGATPEFACLISQTNGIFGVGHGHPVGVDPAQGGVAGHEVDHALCVVCGSDRKEDEREKSEESDYAEPCHDMDIGWG